MIAYQVFRFTEVDGKQEQVQAIGSAHPSQEQAAIKLAQVQRTFATFTAFRFKFEIHQCEATQKQIESWQRKGLVPAESEAPEAEEQATA
jgi:hypothetical protein